MKKLFALASIGLAAFIAVSGEVNAEEAAKNNKLTDNEVIALKSLLSEDAKANFEGDDSLFNYEYIPVSAKKMFKVYAANEVRGDKTYKNKKVLISGVVKKISSSIGDAPVVSLETGDNFRTVNLSFAKKYHDIAIDLNKNQKITFACVGGTVVMGIPSVSDCKPVDIAIQESVNSKMAGINRALSDPKSVDDKNVFVLIVMAKAVGGVTDNFKSCKPDDINCISDKIEAMPKEEGDFQTLMKKTAEDMGIELPGYDKK